MKLTDRRTFIKKASLTAGLFPFLKFPMPIETSSSIDAPLNVSIFSKHLQFLDYRDLGQKAVELGFDGIDLTVRPKGHVLPEEVATELPKAIKEIEAGGSRCEMITTNVASADNMIDREVLQSAAKLGVKYYRPTWFKYPKDKSLPLALEMFATQVESLANFNKELGIIGCYQNHSGKKIGASYWEIHALLEKANPDFFGAQYDIRHAVAEGGRGWENGLQLLKPKVKTIVLKDFLWGKVNGKYKIVNVPIGEGMVDFDRFFKLMKKYKLNPPISLHLEYDLGGAEKGKRELTVDKQVVYDAMKKDLNLVRELWANA